MIEDTTTPTPFFEPMIRGLILGVAFGGLSEAYSTLNQMAERSVGTSNVWDRMIDCTPQFVQDHVLAVGVWIVLYMIETWGIELERSRSPNARKTASAHTRTVVSSMASLPRVLMPLSLELIKLAWLNSPYWSRREVLATAAPRAAADAAQQSQKFSSAVLDESGSTATGIVSAAVDESSSPAPAAATSSNAFVEERPAREGLRPGEWDPTAVGSSAVRRETSRRSYLSRMFYCIGAVPEGGLRTGHLYEAEVLGETVTYWKDDDGHLQARGIPIRGEGVEGVLDGGQDSSRATSAAATPRILQERDGLLYYFWTSSDEKVSGRPVAPAGPCLRGLGKDEMSVTKQCDAPHHIVLQHVASPSALSHAADYLLSGASTGSPSKSAPAALQAALPFLRKRHKVSQGFDLKASSARRVQRVTHSETRHGARVNVTLRLPATVRLEIARRDGLGLALEVHTTPSRYNCCSVTATLKRSWLHVRSADYPVSLLRDRLLNLVERWRAMAEGTPDTEIVLPRLSESGSGRSDATPGPLLRAFYAMHDSAAISRCSVPAEVVKHKYRADM